MERDSHTRARPSNAGHRRQYEIAQYLCALRPQVPTSAFKATSRRFLALLYYSACVLCGHQLEQLKSPIERHPAKAQATI